MAGAHAIGVASRRDSTDHLRVAGAVIAWDDLTDTAAIAALLVPPPADRRHRVRRGASRWT
jgi:hypothetical protein